MRERIEAALAWANARGGAEAVRYFFAVLAGTGVDLTIALIVHYVFGIDLVIAAAAGYVVAVSLTYLVHEFWTFRRADAGVSGVRFVKFIGAAVSALLVRVFLVWITAPLQALPFGALLRLAIGYIGSLVVGFLINRAAVFNANK